MLVSGLYLLASPPPLITKGDFTLMIHGAGIILWADHGFGHNSWHLCQDTIVKGVIIDFDTM